jgi:ribokinase
MLFHSASGANQAVACAKLLPSSSSHRASWCGRFGNDSHATMLQQVLQEHGVDASTATKADVPSGQAYILSLPGGANSIILVGAANHQWPEELPKELEKALQTTAVVMLQREIPQRVNLAVARAAKAAGAVVYLDMGGEESPLSNDLLSHLTFLTANETELARVAGLPTDTEEQVSTAAKQVQKQYGVENILITLGERGSRLFLASASPEVLSEPAEKVANVVDTTGAGDCFRAAFAVAHLEQQDWKACLRFAAKAAAQCIQVKGAMPSMPTRAQVEGK